MPKMMRNLQGVIYRHREREDFFQHFCLIGKLWVIWAFTQTPLCLSLCHRNSIQTNFDEISNESVFVWIDWQNINRNRKYLNLTLVPGINPRQRENNEMDASVVILAELWSWVETGDNLSVNSLHLLIASCIVLKSDVMTGRALIEAVESALSDSFSKSNNWHFSSTLPELSKTRRAIVLSICKMISRGIDSSP